jgi:hypothetical protein
MAGEWHRTPKDLLCRWQAGNRSRDRGSIGAVAITSITQPALRLQLERCVASSLFGLPHPQRLATNRYRQGRKPFSRPLFKLIPWLSFLLLNGASARSQESAAEWIIPAAQEQKLALERIKADSLRGDISFLASDALQGRPTPSEGQQIAAEYIASQFRSAGLAPGGNEDYFQIAPSPVANPNPAGYRFLIRVGRKRFEVSRSRFRMNGVRALDLIDVPLVRIRFSQSATLPDLAGRAVIAELPQTEDPSKPEDVAIQANAFIVRLAELKPRVVIFLDSQNRRDSDYFSHAELILPEAQARPGGDLPVVIINDEAASQAFELLSSRNRTGTISLFLGSPEQRIAKLRNVVGLLQGSDPVLRSSYILVTSHYDGTGPTRGLDFGAVWNAANDDGSGTAAVLQIASALASLEVRPRRSVVFMVFFGEEQGLLGSKYYAGHPLYPVNATVADINLEQLGRTDSTGGDQTNRATLTGFDYTEMGRIFQMAGRRYGITVYKDEKNSDEYFPRSDNQTFANLGIPAQTLCVAIDFPDYHGTGDEWEKIDYENLRRTTQMAALAVLTLAESERAPLWESSIELAKPYLRAFQKLHGERVD